MHEADFNTIVAFSDAPAMYVKVAMHVWLLNKAQSSAWDISPPPPMSLRIANFSEFLTMVIRLEGISIEEDYLCYLVKRR